VGVRWQSRHSLVGSNILLIAPLTQAASRRTINSKPSLEMRVTYLLSPWLWVENAILTLSMDVDFPFAIFLSRFS
jgi:hypothetical protein